MLLKVHMTIQIGEMNKVSEKHCGRRPADRVEFAQQEVLR
jgi:hypothetical protein